MQSINKELHFFLGPLSKKFVMQKMLINSTIIDFVLESIFKESSKLIVAQKNDIISGFMNTLGVVKNPCTFDRLAIKHMFSGKNSIFKAKKACILGVHHQNVALVVQ
jgi:hypothetical protein